MRREVLLSSVIQSDDTPLPTLGLVKGRAKDARLWCYLGDSAHRYAVFEYATDPERAAARGGAVRVRGRSPGADGRVPPPSGGRPGDGRRGAPPRAAAGRVAQPPPGEAAAAGTVRGGRTLTKNRPSVSVRGHTPTAGANAVAESPPRGPPEAIAK